MLHTFKDSYDVVVVGAGPAGSSVAERCAAQGLDVLVLEKRQEIGAPVRCGEGVSQKNMTELCLDLPSHTWRQKILGAYVYAPNGQEIKIRGDGTDGYILERKSFDKWLAEQASRKGAKVVTKATVHDLLIDKTDGKSNVKGVKVNIDGDEYEIKSKIVVAADGVESMTLRLAGIRSQKKLNLVDSAFQYYMCNIKNRDPSMIEIWLGSKITPRGYIWNFPKSADAGNVGIGVGGIGYGKTTKQFLDEWVEKQEWLKEGTILEMVCGMVPVGGIGAKMTGNGIAGVGDAVNMVNPIHGGGIAESIHGGRILGDVIVECNKKNDFSEKSLQLYVDNWRAQRGEKLERIEHVREAFEKMTDDNMNDLAKVVSGEDLADLARGKQLTKFAKIMVNYKMQGVKKFIDRYF